MKDDKESLENIYKRLGIPYEESTFMRIRYIVALIIVIIGYSTVGIGFFYIIYLYCTVIWDFLSDFLYYSIPIFAFFILAWAMGVVHNK